MKNEQRPIIQQMTINSFPLQSNVLQHPKGAFQGDQCVLFVGVPISIQPADNRKAASLKWGSVQLCRAEFRGS